jgi:hypothetical protein
MKLSKLIQDYFKTQILTEIFELQGVVVLAYPELLGMDTIDQRRLFAAESLLKGMNWNALGELIRGLSRGDLETGDSDRGLKHDVKLK